MLKCVHDAGKQYPKWKEQNNPDNKPWLYPEQCSLPRMNPAELAIQRGDSLENVDESAMLDESLQMTRDKKWPSQITCLHILKSPQVVLK